MIISAHASSLSTISFPFYFPSSIFRLSPAETYSDPAMKSSPPARHTSSIILCMNLCGIMSGCTLKYRNSRMPTTLNIFGRILRLTTVRTELRKVNMIALIRYILRNSLERWSMCNRSMLAATDSRSMPINKSYER